jgi:hypothetical protein
MVPQKRGPAAAPARLIFAAESRCSPTVTGNASISGTGVMIYNAGSNYPGNGGTFGGITLSGNGTFNLSAPTSGTYAGILIFQSRQNTRALSLSGNAMAGMSKVLDAVLADLFTGADLSRGQEADRTSGVAGLPGPWGVEDGTTSERIPLDWIDPADFARPVGLTPGEISGGPDRRRLLGSSGPLPRRHEAACKRAA